MYITGLVKSTASLEAGVIFAMFTPVITGLSAVTSVLYGMVTTMFPLASIVPRMPSITNPVMPPPVGWDAVLSHWQDIVTSQAGMVNLPFSMVTVLPFSIASV